MSVITISSTNPSLSHVLAKNPATIRDSNTPFRRELRQGNVYGWFATPDNQTFRLWFKDHPTRSSFAGGVLGEFEYLDMTRYGSPHLPIMMIQTALASAYKSRQEHDVDGHLTSVVTTIKVPSERLLEQMAMHYEGKAEISLVRVSSQHCKVMVGASTTFMALNVLQALCVMMAMRDDDSDVRLDRSGVEKYIRVLNNAESPYYVRYLFGSRAITNRHMFDEVVESLQGPGMVLKFGDTQRQRFDAITQHLRGGPAKLVDIGCGDMYYSARLAGKYAKVVALDCDEELCTANLGRVKARSLTNVDVVHTTADGGLAEAMPELLCDPGTEVLMTEVLEHMPREQADGLLRCVLSQPGVTKVVATVPNSAFNENYGMGDDFRHPDHHYEPSFEEWSDYTVSLGAEYGLDVYNEQVGDIVHGQSVSTMTVFTRKKA